MKICRAVSLFCLLALSSLPVSIVSAAISGAPNTAPLGAQTDDPAQQPEECPMPSPQNSSNLIANPSFEVLADNVPVSWTSGAPRAEISPEFTSDTQFAHSGSRSLRMSGAGRAGVVGWVTSAGAPVRAGNTYELRAHFRAEDVPNLHGSVWVKLVWRRDAKDEMPYVAYLNEMTREGDWWSVSGRLKAPAAASLAEVSLSLRHAPQGLLWWDDISLREVPTVPDRRLRIATAHLPGSQHADPQAWQRMIEAAGEGHADVVCLGELARVTTSSADRRSSIPGPATEALADFARRYHMMIVVSISEWDGALHYNTAVIIGRDGRLLGRYRKTHLSQDEIEEGTTPGTSLPVFDTELGRFGVQVCYDHFFPEVSRALALQGAEVIFTPIWGDTRSNRTAYTAVARARALDNSVYYVMSTYSLPSLIIDPAGNILAETTQEPGVVFADINLDEPRYERWLSVPGEAEFRCLWPKERRPELYETLVLTE